MAASARVFSLIPMNPGQSDAIELPSNIEFRDSDAAVRHLGRLGRRVSRSIFDTFLHFLVACPDPDSVVVQFERLMESATSELAVAFEKRPTLIHYAALVFGHSMWLGETLIQNIDLFSRFGRDRMLERSYSREEYKQESLAPALAVVGKRHCDFAGSLPEKGVRTNPVARRAGDCQVG